MLSHILQTEGSSMLEAISSFAQAIANTLLLSRHGEAELLLGLIVGLAFVVALAREFDAQPFHIDEDAAKRSFAGGLIASGWQSCGFLMRLAFTAEKIIA